MFVNTSKPHEYCLFRQAKIRIDESFTDEDFSLKAVASTIKITPTKLTIIFKKFSGMTPKKYTNILRFSHANKLLLNPEEEIKIKEVARQIGYTNASTQAFREWYKQQFIEFAESEIGQDAETLKSRPIRLKHIQEFSRRLDQIQDESHFGMGCIQANHMIKLDDFDKTILRVVSRIKFSTFN